MIRNDDGTDENDGNGGVYCVCAYSFSSFSFWRSERIKLSRALPKFLHQQKKRLLVILKVELIIKIINFINSKQGTLQNREKTVNNKYQVS